MDVVLNPRISLKFTFLSEPSQGNIITKDHLPRQVTPMFCLPGETPSRAGDGLLDRISGSGDALGLTTGTSSSVIFPNKALMLFLLFSGTSSASLKIEGDLTQT